MARYKFTPGGMMLQWVTILMGVNIVMLLIGSVSSMMEISLLGRLIDGENVTEEQIAANDLRQGATGFLQVGVYIVLAILFLRLLSRANRNARSMGAKGMEFTPGWCIGWFFVPIAHLFKPYKAVKEIWQASAPSPDKWQNNPVPPLVGLWWAMWIISAIADQVSFRLSLRAESANEILVSSYATLASELIEIPLCVVALLMVRSLYEVQQEKSRLNREDLAIGERLASSCPACGETLASTAPVCPMCGHQFGSQNQTDDTFGNW